VQWQRPDASPKKPQGHGFIANVLLRKMPKNELSISTFICCASFEAKSFYKTLFTLIIFFKDC